MKKITFLLLSLSFSFAQGQQLGNSDMELWENIGQATEEPTNWNSFKTAQGPLTTFASQQIQRSTLVRTGASGQYCARVWAKSTLGVVANGLMTLGRVNMGSTNVNDPNNYNISLTANPNFSEALAFSPDSLVFWAKFTAVGSTDSARVHAILHDSYDVRDPIDANSQPYVLAIAERNYAKTNGSWVRISVPFNYFPSTNVSPAFLLITFATNKIPGGGTNNDEVLLDDIELVYNNSVGSQNLYPSTTSLSASYSENQGLLIKGDADFIQILSLEGKIHFSGTIEEINGLKLHAGLYFINTKNTSIKILIP
ncbi:MAG: hypothetical protein ACKO6A_01875 [Bacteroidota bacterium]